MRPAPTLTISNILPMPATYDSLLIIGDPHASSKPIGRRKSDYTWSVLNKLEQAAVIAHQQNSFTVITGDLLHTNDDNDLSFLNRLSRVLQQFPGVCVLVGNHDKMRGRESLSDVDALTLLLGLRGVLPLESQVIEVQGHSVHLEPCPYGHAIPQQVPRALTRDGAVAQCCLLFTHHDLAFGGAYPGSAPLHPIEGVDCVINGHMHDTKPSVRLGDTVWHNPGNIEPVSIDLAAHRPAVWLWKPESLKTGALTPVYLEHNADCFDLTGLQVEAGDSHDAVRALAGRSTPEGAAPSQVPAQAQAHSMHFVEQLQAEATASVGRTADLSVIEADIQAVAAELHSSPAAVSYLDMLLSRVRQSGRG